MLESNFVGTSTPKIIEAKSINWKSFFIFWGGDRKISLKSWGWGEYGTENNARNDKEAIDDEGVVLVPQDQIKWYGNYVITFVGNISVRVLVIRSNDTVS